MSLRARVRGAPVELDLAAENDAGDAVLLRLRELASGRFITRTPARGRLKLVGLEVSVVAAEAVGLAHRAGEGVQAAIPEGSLVLGPLRSARPHADGLAEAGSRKAARCATRVGRFVYSCTPSRPARPCSFAGARRPTNVRCA